MFLKNLSLVIHKKRGGSTGYSGHKRTRVTRDGSRHFSHRKGLRCSETGQSLFGPDVGS